MNKKCFYPQIRYFFLSSSDAFDVQVEFFPKESFNSPVFFFDDIKNCIDIRLLHLIEGIQICKLPAIFRPVCPVKPAHILQFIFQTWIRPHIIPSYRFLRYTQSKEQKCRSNSCPVFSCGTVKNNSSVLYVSRTSRKRAYCFKEYSSVI